MTELEGGGLAAAGLAPGQKVDLYLPKSCGETCLLELYKVVHLVR